MVIAMVYSSHTLCSGYVDLESDSTCQEKVQSLLDLLLFEGTFYKVKNNACESNEY